MRLLIFSVPWKGVKKREVSKSAAKLRTFFDSTKLLNYIFQNGTVN